MYIWLILFFFAFIPYVLPSGFRGGLLSWTAVDETEVCLFFFNLYVFFKYIFEKLNTIACGPEFRNTFNFEVKISEHISCQPFNFRLVISKKEFSLLFVVVVKIDNFQFKKCAANEKENFLHFFLVIS